MKSNNLSENNLLDDLKFEIRRKIFHLVLGLILIMLVYFDIITWNISIIILFSGLVLSWYYKYASNTSISKSKFFKKNFFYKIIDYFIKTFERKKNFESFPGKNVISIFFSLTILLFFFEKKIILASLIIWCIGDASCAIFGTIIKTINKNNYLKNSGKTIGFPHYWNAEKFIEVTLIAIFISIIATYKIVGLLPAIIASIIALIIESLEFKSLIDDNISIPLISALTIYVITVI